MLAKRVPPCQDRSSRVWAGAALLRHWARAGNGPGGLVPPLLCVHVLKQTSSGMARGRGRRGGCQRSPWQGVARLPGAGPAPRSGCCLPWDEVGWDGVGWDGVTSSSIIPKVQLPLVSHQPPPRAATVHPRGKVTAVQGQHPRGGSPGCRDSAQEEGPRHAGTSPSRKVPTVQAQHPRDKP